MAVRQYVGARYVPKFYQNSQNPLSSEWEGNVAYEALTVVTYNNSSYTSKIPVPAGIGNPASNPTYWVVTGAYNAQVEQYRQDVETAVSGVDEKLNQTTTKIEGDMQTLKTDVDNSVQQVQEQANEVQSNLTQEIADRKQADTDLEEKLSTLAQTTAKHIVIIADSYGTDNGGGVAVTGYPTRIKQLLPKYTIDSSAQNGAGFANGNFLSQLNNMEASDEVSEIYVFGGWNDEFQRAGVTEEGVYSGMTNFANAAKEKFPNAHLYLGMLAGGYGYEGNYLIDNLLTTNEWYQNCTQHGFNSYLPTEGICWNLIPSMWADPNTEQGKLHPSDLLEAEIARTLAGTILTKSVNLYRQTVLSDPNEFTPAIENSEIVMGQMIQTLDNNYVSTWLGPIGVRRASESASISVNSETVIATVPDTSPKISGGIRYYNRIPAMLEFVDNDGNFTYTLCSLVLVRNKLQILDIAAHQGFTGQSFIVHPLAVTCLYVLRA